LAGINFDPDGVGFKKIIIRPNPVGDLTWVRAEHQSPYGLIRSSWQRKGEKFTLEITIPVNTTATIYVPSSDAESVTEGDRPDSAAKDMQFVGIEGKYAVFAVGSGKYRFTSKLGSDIGQ
jgi:alpha-L-rhamnosidase